MPQSTRREQEVYTPKRLISAVLALLVTACGQAGDDLASSSQVTAPSANGSEGCRTVQHEMGETVICGQPQNVVVLGHNMLELLLALDIQPAGFADRLPFHSIDYDNPAQQIPYLGKWITSQPVNVGLVLSPSLEAITKAAPDLILGSTQNAGQYETLSQIAPTLLFEWFDTEANLRAIAVAVGHPERAAPLLARMEQQVASAQAEFASVVAEHPKVLMLLSVPQLTDLTLETGHFSFCGALMTDIGFQLVYPSELSLAELNQPVSISLETLPQFSEADSIILLGFNNQTNQLMDMEEFEQHQLKGLAQQWEKNAIAQSLDASQAGRVYLVPAYLCLGLPGPIGTELYLEELKQQLLGPNKNQI